MLQAFTKACSDKNLDEVKNLINNKIIDINDKQLATELFYIASDKLAYDIMKYLIEIGVDKNNIRFKDIDYACSYNCLDRVKFFMEECGINPFDKETYIISYNYPNDIVKYLVDNDYCDINVECSIGRSYLYQLHDDFPKIKFAIEECGADVNIGLKSHETLLALICERFNNLEIVKYLVEHGAKVNICGQPGSILRTLFYRSTFKNIKAKTKILEYLLTQKHDKLSKKYILHGLKYCLYHGSKYLLQQSAKIILEHNIELYKELFFDYHVDKYNKEIDELRLEYSEAKNILDNYFPSDISNIIINDTISLHQLDIIVNTLRGY